MESPVDNPLGSMAAFNRQFQVGKTGTEAAEWGYHQEPGDTMFHVINAYTRGAQFKGLTAEESYHLERVGGLILAMVSK